MIPKTKIPLHEPEPNEAEAIDEILKGYGHDLPTEVILELEKLICRLSIRRAGEGLLAILKTLPQKTEYVALARAVCGDSGRTLEDDARLTKTSRQNLHKHCTKLKKALTAVDKKDNG